jgi:hypothetical protein
MAAVAALTVMQSVCVADCCAHCVPTRFPCSLFSVGHPAPGSSQPDGAAGVCGDQVARRPALGPWEEARTQTVTEPVQPV